MIVYVIHYIYIFVYMHPPRGGSRIWCYGGRNSARWSESTTCTCIIIVSDVYGTYKIDSVQVILIIWGEESDTEPLFSLSLFSFFSIYFFFVFIGVFFVVFLGGGRTSLPPPLNPPVPPSRPALLVIIKDCIVLKQVYSGHFCKLFIYR